MQKCLICAIVLWTMEFAMPLCGVFPNSSGVLCKDRGSFSSHSVFTFPKSLLVICMQVFTVIAWTALAGVEEKYVLNIKDVVSAWNWNGVSWSVVELRRAPEPAYVWECESIGALCSVCKIGLQFFHTCSSQIAGIHLSFITDYGM